MNIEKFRNYCLSKQEATESFPFDEDTLVFKVAGKMFALVSISEKPMTVNLKMDPEIILEWRERYSEITPGFHMNKQYWNSVILSDNIPLAELKWLIDHSYAEVVKKLPKKVRIRFEV
jgi:predicted DNA-binding protein (MmcQ/YjbR family)